MLLVFFLFLEMGNISDGQPIGKNFPSASQNIVRRNFRRHNPLENPSEPIEIRRKRISHECFSNRKNTSDIPSEIRKISIRNSVGIEQQF